MLEGVQRKLLCLNYSKTCYSKGFYMCESLGEFVYREKQIFEKKNQTKSRESHFHGEIHVAHINIIFCKHGP